MDNYLGRLQYTILLEGYFGPIASVGEGTSYTADRREAFVMLWFLRPGGKTPDYPNCAMGRNWVSPPALKEVATRYRYHTRAPLQIFWRRPGQWCLHPILFFYAIILWNSHIHLLYSKCCIFICQINEHVTPIAIFLSGAR